MWYSNFQIIVETNVTKTLKVARDLFLVLFILCTLQCCLDSYIGIFNQLQYSAMSLPLTDLNIDTS